MLFLIINNGSTSFRFSLVDLDQNTILASGGVENINSVKSYFTYKNFKNVIKKGKKQFINYKEAFNIMCNNLLDSNIGVISSTDMITAIGHRIVHGGENYINPTIINKNVLKDIMKFSKMAPIHNLQAVKTINDCQEHFTKIPNIAVFDTAFHSTIPKENFIYPIPKVLYERYKIRKYGFHGISFNYVLERYSKIINKKKKNINTVICHLGGGSSICAIKNGKSFDTTMEYSPLSGLMMASRSGNIDPAVIPEIMNKYNISAEQTIEILNSKSGYLAIANSKDMKSIVEKSLNGDKNSIFLRKMINHDFKKNLLSMMSNLDKVDSIILTGGIGSKNKEQREMLLSDLEFWGIVLDKNKNNLVFNTEGIISSDKSKIQIYVIPTNEELEIAKNCQKLLKKERKGNSV